MDNETVITIASAIIAGLSFLGTITIFLITKRREDYQNLHERISFYFSPEMHLAINQLWVHYREFGEEKFVDKYLEIMQTDKQRLADCEPKDQIEFLRSTLHYQRRLVTAFWRGFAILMKNNLLPKKAVYAFWTQDSLDIVNKILIPVEDELADYLHTGSLNQESEPLFFC